MRILLLTATSCILGGCGSLDQIVCYGTGTCEATVGYAGSSRWTSPTPSTVITDKGTYIYVRDQQSGAIMSVIKTSDGKYQ